MEKKSLTFREMKFASSEADAPTMSFSGYGSAFNNVDSYGDIVAAGAFAKSIEEHKAAGTMPAMLWNHDGYAMPIGIWTDMAEDDYGLKISGHFIDTSTGRDAYVITKSGAVTGLSIGFIVRGFEIQKIEGKTIRLITDIDLHEVSVVTFPANKAATINDVKSMEINMNKKSIERLSALFAEADELLKNLTADESEDETESGDENVTDTEAETDEDASDDNEAKYNQAVIDAVKNITLSLTTMEKYDR
jgi:uncharacterized protein